MADYWKERIDPLRDPVGFRNRWPESCRGFYLPDDSPPPPQRYDEWMYFVRVCGFTFRFTSLDELRHALEYFRRKTHPSSRIAMPHDIRRRMDRAYFRMVMNAQHDDWQRWYERIPIKLQANARRERVVRALERALDEFGA